jgi:hypothetical protein
MISATSNIHAAVLSNAPSSILLRILDPTGDQILSTTTAPFDVVFKDNTYYSNAILVSTSPPKFTTLIGGGDYTFVVTDPDLLALVSFNNGLVGYSAEVYVVYLENDTPIDDEGYLIFKGKINSVSQTTKTDVIGENTLICTCSSPLYSLDYEKGFLLSHEKVSTTTLGDDCCINIASDKNTGKLKWGYVNGR